MLKLIMIFLVVLNSLPAVAGAGPVGQFTQVVGQVDRLPGNALPAAVVAMHDRVHGGDCVRTKSQSKAEIQFLDKSLVTVAPCSRVLVENYAFDPGAPDRNANLLVKLGLICTDVVRLFKRDNPNFTVETPTAIIGIRGTKTFTLIFPTATEVYNESGQVEGRSRNPAHPGRVVARAMEFFRVEENRPPTRPQPFDQDTLRYLNRLMTIGLSAQIASGGLCTSSATNQALTSCPGLENSRSLPERTIIPTLVPQPVARVAPPTPAPIVTVAPPVLPPAPQSVPTPTPSPTVSTPTTPSKVDPGPGPGPL